MSNERLILCRLCAAIPLIFAVTGCHKAQPGVRAGNPPDQTSVWTGREGRLHESGNSSNLIYGLLAQSDDDRLLVLWKWERGSLEEVVVSKFQRCSDVVPVSTTVCGLNPYVIISDWDYELVSLRDGKTIKGWDLAKGWYVLRADASRNGKFIGLIIEQGPDAIGHDFDKPRAHVAVIDAEKQEWRWAKKLTGNGIRTVRGIAVTDDGRYVAVAGWNNGTALIDATAHKILWNNRPPSEVGTGYAVFAPDGKLIYTAGSEGCVYGIDVATGNVVSQRWATLTGESEYAHRVSALTLSNDGKWLAAGTGPQGEVYVWNLEDKKNQATVFNHGRGSIMLVSFSPDSGKLASIGGGYLKVWTLPAPGK